MTDLAASGTSGADRTLNNVADDESRAPILVTVSCATADEAQRILHELVGRRLVAAGQTWPVSSCYRWQGNVIGTMEHMLLVKTVSTRFKMVSELIGQLHSYQLPSVVAVPVTDAGPGYQDWLDESIS